jgi:hypothetical protein
MEPEEFKLKDIPFSFSDSLKDRIDNALKSLGCSLSDSKILAADIMQLSNFYAKNPSAETPWNEKWCQRSYLGYYLPLNWWRLMFAIERGKSSDFFTGFNQYVDFGSGLGATSFAMAAHGLEFKEGGVCIEHSDVATKLHKELSVGSSQTLNWQKTLSTLSITDQTLAVFSYSFTELKEIPEWALACDGLMIVEPAVQQDARRLMAVRKDLIAKGWIIKAPCTHQQSCPLLELSERDWCHDRATWTKPQWLEDIEKHMPIKNGTLPFSYLLALKSPAIFDTENVSLARVTGDLQDFKGYSKQLICRGPEREFVSWQHRHFGKDVPNIPRGSLVHVASEIETKGNELRPKKLSDVFRK